ncbi:MAG: GH3 auxin-responsive promoter family protein [Rikenellaceae bacterium]
MSLLNNVIKLYFSQRAKAVDEFRRRPLETQQRMFSSLLESGSRSKFGAEYNITPSMSWESFSRTVPIFEYDDFKPYIERMLAGERDVTTPGRVRYYAKSSGTTSDRSKFIPISDKALHTTHRRGMQDVGMLYLDAHPGGGALNGKFLSLGGSCSRQGGNLIGDLSAILINDSKIVSGWFRAPKMSTALIKNFEQKCQRICQESTRDNITAFVGVPSWNLALMSRILDYTGKSSLREVWPNLSLFVHGGIEMGPYRQSFDKLYGGEGLQYMETYNASEGFVAIADDPSRDDMLLMLDYDTFYEFRSESEVVPLEGVKLGVHYAVIMTSINGLWRYEIGDTVEFTSLSPYRIKFAGRTKQYINTFGEEVMVDNTDRAVVEASRRLGVVVSDYSVAPRYMDINSRGGHEWIVEFVTPPLDIELFTKELDSALRSINSDYDAKRESTLEMLTLNVAPRGMFLRWMEEHGKNKIPRLSKERTAFESMLSMINR